MEVEELGGSEVRPIGILQQAHKRPDEQLSFHRLR
jgi:hypothetical protein